VIWPAKVGRPRSSFRGGGPESVTSPAASISLED
jgi:hypothetical protein